MIKNFTIFWKKFRNSSRIFLDRFAGKTLLFCSVLILVLVLAMGVGLTLKSIPVLQEISFSELMTGSDWQPFKNKFGFLPFLMGTVYVTLIAVLIALPLSLLSAIFLTEYAHRRIKKYVFPVLDILASLPSVIYGVWGVLVIVPLVSDLTPESYGFSSGYTLLAAGIVAAIMIVPLMVSLFVEVFSTVSQDLRDASFAMGATRWQTAIKVVVKKTLPGIFASVVLAVSRALGETIAILMVCGNMAKVPESLFDACYPLPSLLANNYGEMLSLPIYESALMFAALILFVVVIVFNLVSRLILRKIRE
ncbi:MAG: phosphate ABC transporter permease subunit PstC [Bacteroidales bacterium]|jgi:phosphate transport system permease protein|nr:phosphate ABC transporter permease subunit PstC [Bacteroidales bacterium]